ncbi:hypothetical protein SOVF_021010 [Spinacia oleracea]|uniref:Uncharacterized protein At4g04980 n=1 Tax=Spinacia oleracea TaxID=3562 RepID=A0A9R0HRC1_SPIOL|nr:uncharacterized protein At4g04980-like [Spinacia oleracea]KNA23899.1 hypothetical protein SOVF_021010 [Spinacia oleracea]
MVNELCTTPPSKGFRPPPPPPGGMKSKNTKNDITKLKRSSNMGNLFRLLRGKMEGSSVVEKSSRGRNNGAGGNGGASDGQSMDDAFAEIARRSTYFKQIEQDVKTHEKTIKEMQATLISFKTKDMDSLIKFYHQVESKLDVLTDENQVLSRFEGFPVKKLDALRMAAVLYRKLSGILSELHNWSIESPLAQLLDKVEKYFNKIKGEVEALERTKDDEEKKYQSHNIHFDFNILLKIKEAMVNVSSSCIELALKEWEESKAASNNQTLPKARNRQKKVCTKTLWRTFQFAFKVYSFAGGQDERAERLTKELATEIEADPMKD